MEIRDEVYRGGEWLDNLRPGWFEQINLDTLNIGSCQSCVCGQLFAADAADSGWNSGYGYVIRRLLPAKELRLGYGFGLTYNIEKLTEEWKAYIQMRRDSALAEAKAKELELVPA